MGYEQKSVQADMFDDSSAVQGYPYFGDKEKYFPLQVSSKRLESKG